MPHHAVRYSSTISARLECVNYSALSRHLLVWHNVRSDFGNAELWLTRQISCFRNAKQACLLILEVTVEMLTLDRLSKSHVFEANDSSATPHSSAVVLLIIDFESGPSPAVSQRRTCT